jgi:ornithine carbamoyltransferase
MAIHMKGKSLASLYDLTGEEIEQILKTSELLKLQLLRGQEHPLLKGKTLAMIFEKAGGDHRGYGPGAFPLCGWDHGTGLCSSDHS